MGGSGHEPQERRRARSSPVKPSHDSQTKLGAVPVGWVYRSRSGSPGSPHRQLPSLPFPQLRLSGSICGSSPTQSDRVAPDFGYWGDIPSPARGDARPTGRPGSGFWRSFWWLNSGSWLRGPSFARAAVSPTQSHLVKPFAEWSREAARLGTSRPRPGDWGGDGSSPRIVPAAKTVPVRPGRTQSKRVKPYSDTSSSTPAPGLRGCSPDRQPTNHLGSHLRSSVPICGSHQARSKSVKPSQTIPRIRLISTAKILLRGQIRINQIVGEGNHRQNPHGK